MKRFQIAHAPSAQYRTGIVLANGSEHPQMIQLHYLDASGALRKSQNELLPPRAKRAILPPAGDWQILIDGPDSLGIECQLNCNGNFSPLSVKEMAPTVLNFLFHASKAGRLALASTFSYTHNPANPQARYLDTPHALILDLILRSIYYDYPDRLCRLANVGDACMLDPLETVPTHPTHRGSVVDLDYFTLTENPITQYGPPPHQNLWDGDRLRMDVFDEQRVGVLVEHFLGAFPEGKPRLDSKMEQPIKDAASTSIWFDKRIVWDEDHAHNHGTHIHLDPGTETEMDARWDY